MGRVPAKIKPPKPAPRRPAGGHSLRALRALRDLAQAVAVDLGHDPEVPLPIGTLTLPISFPVQGEGRLDDEMIDALMTGMRAHIADALKGVEAWRPGSVYSFQASGPEGRHPRPPGPEMTFAGYSAVGRPQWTSLTNLCLRLADPRVDRLYKGSAHILALVLEGEALTGDLLDGFGAESMAFKVHGQVVAGLLPADFGVPGAAPKDADRLVLTAQVVEIRAGAERARLRLNVLGIREDDLHAAAADGGERSPAESMRAALNEARTQVQALGDAMTRGESSGKGEASIPQIHRILMALSRDIERAFRAPGRRTAHAQERHSQGDRPTSHALRDLERATDDQILDDARRQTIVVLGPKSRCHIFAEDGRLVTSLRLKAGEAERRVERRRWRPRTADASRQFRQQAEGILRRDADS